jgi:hypothetical protein
VLRLISPAVLLAVLAAPTQDKDFLTASEIDQLRVTQAIPLRLQLYLKFAEQRLDRLDSTFKIEKAGRSALIHDLLDEFTKIVEAIDYVTEDTLKLGRELESVTVVAEAEKKMLERLAAYRAAAPRDMARYQFVLDNAIDTTRDSIEVNEQDLRDRKRDVLTRAEEERKLREAMTAREGPKAAEAKAAEGKSEPGKEAKKDDEQKAPRKAPTLYRKGEKKEEKK